MTSPNALSRALSKMFSGCARLLSSDSSSRRANAALALCASLLAATFAATAASAHTDALDKVRVPLDKGWTFRKIGGGEWPSRGARKGEWLKARVPGSVHTDLLANRLIEDPFYRDNEPKLQWIGKSDWEYRTTFDAKPDLLSRRHVELVFDGLDTYATVSLNGVPLLEADNMFRTWRVDCKRALKPGANELRILFRSPINEILPRMKTLGYELPASHDQGAETSPHTRKAPYQYGWDWGPRFVTSGVCRPARLEAWDDARLVDLHVVQNQLGKDAAQLTAEVEVESSGASDAVVVVEDAADKGVSARQTFK